MPIRLTHATVLLEDAVDHILVNRSGTYIDGTFGRGGHSKLILNSLTCDGRLIAFDKDLAAIQASAEIIDDRFTIIHGSFRDMSLLGELYGKVSGILLDLGVSSPQIDDASRGFSFMHDGILDMRMDNTKGISAAEWVSDAGENEIANVLYKYGDERYSRRIAKAIVTVRQQTKITSTLQLAQIIKDAHPKWQIGRHPATQSFQAMRIHINNELQDLEIALAESIQLLVQNGRLVVISFHSLEDRIVKNFIRNNSRTIDSTPMFMPSQPVHIIKPSLKSIGRFYPSDIEISNNARARSAVMRVAEKI